ncbi:energy transducer TonB [Flavobacterium sp.]|uniref:energy transducer TonB n=1 Tax=Flavobacterium sp. TaxID=239 RepID=UPI0035294033
MRYQLIFLLFTFSLFGQENKSYKYFPFTDICNNESDYFDCEREIFEKEILGLITPEIENDITQKMIDNKTSLTFAFVYSPNKSIREDIDIDFLNEEIKVKIIQFLLQLQPYPSDENLEDTIKAKRFEFVFIKNSENKLFIASDELLKEMKFKSEFKFIERPYPIECKNSIDIESCINKYFSSHIVKNFRYPNKALRKGIQGKVECNFYIDKDGSIVIKELNGPDKILEDEAKRILNKIPKLVNATIKGVPVKVSFSIPITFKLD